MTNEEILTFAGSMSYAYLHIEERLGIGSGRGRWEQAVACLSLQQREKLVARIQHWHDLVAREHDRKICTDVDNLSTGRGVR